jgi:hypothetical protein
VISGFKVDDLQLQWHPCMLEIEIHTAFLKSPYRRSGDRTYVVGAEIDCNSP